MEKGREKVDSSQEECEEAKYSKQQHANSRRAFRGISGRWLEVKKRCDLGKDHDRTGRIPLKNSDGDSVNHVNLKRTKIMRRCLFNTQGTLKTMRKKQQSY